MKEMNMKSRKAISPVIATVILVAVAITIAVAVSYWMSGISSQYTKFEKVEIQSAQCIKTTDYWTITLSLKNSGSATATLNGVYVNDQVATYRAAATVPVTPFTNLYADVDSTNQKTINSGQPGTVTIYLGSGWPTGAALTSGTTIDIKLHSAGGMDYIKLIGLV
jgi:archaeal type IV pilus assembly protein PilA